MPQQTTVPTRAYQPRLRGPRAAKAEGPLEPLVLWSRLQHLAQLRSLLNLFYMENSSRLLQELIRNIITRIREKGHLFCRAGDGLRPKREIDVPCPVRTIFNLDTAEFQQIFRHLF